MTTAWRCAPCQRMRWIQITQWSGSWACNLLANIEFRCGWSPSLKRVGLCWLGRSAADRVAATRADASQAESASCHCNQYFCPPSESDAHLQIRRAPRSAATWVDVIGHLGTNFSEILIRIQTFLFMKMHLKMSSAKWRPFGLGHNVLTKIMHMLCLSGMLLTRY